ncbi:type II secretion system protein [bacterium]|nr:type II secretion system protein [bacterium]
MKHTFSRGFSIVELLVVTAIVVMVTALLLSNHAKFGSVVVLERLAYQVASTVRKAQVYGTSVYRNDIGGFASSYGVFATLSSPSSYLLFTDTVSANGIYDTGESYENIQLMNGYTVRKLCATPPGGSEDCAFTSLNILFKRPEPDALIRTQAGGVLQESAKIILRSPQNDCRAVFITATGQVEVRVATCS